MQMKRPVELLSSYHTAGNTPGKRQLLYVLTAEPGKHLRTEGTVKKGSRY